MAFGKRSLLWLRAGCVVVSVVALSIVIHRIDARALLEAVRSMRPGWFLAALAVYGLLFLPAAWRWHLTLRLARSSMRPVVTIKFSYIGHFFYTILFGAAGGDFAKSALYARRHRFPLPKVLAAASLDRLLGLGGLVLFMGLAFLLAALNNGLSVVRSISWKLPGVWLAVFLFLIAVLFFAFRNPARQSALGRFVNAFRDNSRQLLASPKIFLQGLLCAFLVQLALSATLALNLCAVNHEPIPWLRLIWTLPLISIISALPITIAGMGVREGAALVLLGWCGISGANAVAASVLTAVVSLTWAIAGGILFWRESFRRRTGATAAETPALPALNGWMR